MQVKDSEDRLQTWEFSAPRKFAINTATLDVPGEKTTHKSYLDIYRGGAGEASLRLTGVVTADGDWVVLGEGRVSWWFNDVFGWQNYYLSKQRWGMSARYFATLSKLPVTSDTGNEDVDLKVAQADIRYRLSPGLWEKDRDFGFDCCLRNNDDEEILMRQNRAGIFWARSMPQGLDYLLSKDSAS